MNELLEPSLHALVEALRGPVIAALFGVCAIAVVDLGTALGERCWGLATIERRGDANRAEALARRRIERADLLARVGPMLGLMGTLIPLGPGLAALGRGDMAELAASVTVAFDTTVVGLLVGAAGYALGALRRRWYHELLGRLEGNDA